MQELINRASETADTVFGCALYALQPAVYFGVSYIALSLLVSLLARLAPVRAKS